MHDDDGRVRTLTLLEGMIPGHARSMHAWFTTVKCVRIVVYFTYWVRGEIALDFEDLA